MNKTQIAALEKQLRRLNTEKRAYISAGDSHLYVSRLFPKKSAARQQLEDASQDAFAWAAELQLQIDEVETKLRTAQIALN